VADIETTLEQQIFYLSQGQRITDVHHHREADHLGRTVEITKRITHLRRLRNAPPRLKPIYSDNALALLSFPLLEEAPLRIDLDQQASIAFGELATEEPV
jgi:hypothetical protein